jgi:hypothetical protein
VSTHRNCQLAGIPECVPVAINNDDDQRPSGEVLDGAAAPGLTGKIGQQPLRCTAGKTITSKGQDGRFVS